MTTREGAAPSSYSNLADVIEALPFLVREARRARGLSVRAAAVQIGCSFSTISRFENGDDVNLSNATALLRWLNQRPEPACPACSDPDDPRQCCFTGASDDPECQ